MCLLEVCLHIHTTYSLYESILKYHRTYHAKGQFSSLLSLDLESFKKSVALKFLKGKVRAAAFFNVERVLYTQISSWRWAQVSVHGLR